MREYNYTGRGPKGLKRAQRGPCLFSPEEDCPLRHIHLQVIRPPFDLSEVGGDTPKWIDNKKRGGW